MDTKKRMRTTDYTDVTDKKFRLEDRHHCVLQFLASAALVSIPTGHLTTNEHE
jgi:hypothetical protein